MSRFPLWLIAATVLALVFVGGCFRKPGEAAAPPVTAATPGGPAAAGAPEAGAAPGSPVAPGAPAVPGAPLPAGTAARGTAAAPAVALTGDLAKIAALRKQLKSYQVTESGRPADANGEPVVRTTEVKLADGMQVRRRTVGNDTYRLTLMDQHAAYEINTQNKTAMHFVMPAPGAAPGGAGHGPANGAPRGLPGGAPAGQRGGGGGRGMSGGFFDPAAVARLKPATSSVKLAGVDCWLVQWKDGRGQPVQMWLDKQYGLTRQSATPMGTMTYGYTKINSVPTSDFELPSGLKVTDSRAGWGALGGPGGGGPGGGGRRRGGGGPPAAPPAGSGAGSY